jgi:hypothetical protein
MTMTTQTSIAFIKAAKSINVDVEPTTPFIELLDGLAEINQEIAQNYCQEVLSTCDEDELANYINNFTEVDGVMDLFFYGFDFIDSNLGEAYWNKAYVTIEKAHYDLAEEIMRDLF